MSADLSIEQVIQIITKRLALVLLIPIVSAAASGLYSKYMIDDIYQASSTVIVSNTKNTAVLTISDYSLNVQLVDSYSVLCETNRVLNQVIDELELPLTTAQLREKVSVTAVGDTEIIHILVNDADPVMARKINNTLTRIFQSEVKNIMKIDNVQIIDDAPMPGAPIEPNRVRNVILGALIGLVGGIALAFLIEYLDRSVKSEAQITEAIGVPVLGSIPKINRDKSPGGTQMKIFETATGKYSSKTDMAISAVFGKLKANIDFSFVRITNLCLMITSSLPDEGKTTIAANIAAAMASSGKKTLLLDADMRNATVHLMFNQDNALGLSDIISKNADWRQCLIKIAIPNLYIISGGRKPLNTTKFITSPEFAAFIQEIKTEFDYVVLDTPPILVIPDSQIMSPLVDGVILVINSGKTPLAELKNAGELLKRANANLIGAVLNNVEVKGGVYGYGYGYGYGYDKDKKVRPNNGEPAVRQINPANGHRRAALVEKKMKDLDDRQAAINTYCLLCRTGAEQSVAKTINKHYQELTAVAPVRILQEKHDELWTDREQALLPGHVFLFTDRPLPLDMHRVVDNLNKAQEFDKGMRILTGVDEEFARWIYRHKGRIEMSKVKILEGQEPKLIDGPLMDFKGSIVKFDKNKHRVTLEVTFDGHRTNVILGAKYVLPVESSDRDTVT